MLYVFQMDIGQMLTFDMSLLMDTVARLQTEICKTTGISVDQQILLLSGGQSLKPDQKVMAYGAGADTNPVFLFSKLAIESQEPPVIRSYISSKDLVVALKERVTDSMKLRPSYDTVNLRAKLAVQMREGASNIYNYCKNEFQEQHLQHQGWGAVIANLEEIADALQRTQIKFSKVFHAFVPLNETHFQVLEGFGEILNLMSQIPLLDSLKEPSGDGMDMKFKGGERSVGGSFHGSPNTLLDWICSQAQGQGIDSLHQKCEDDLKTFNEIMFESYDKQVQDLLSVVRMDPNQMKELVGIERRLSELEKRLNEAKRIASSQNDMAQGFINHQSKLSSLPDVNSILPDLCESHKQQLSQMLDSQQRIVALQNNFRNSKQEMSRNIHQRLGWVMHVETKVAKLDSELIFHIKTLKVLERNLDLLSQIKVAPGVYASLVVETARRRTFSQKFSQWAEILEEDSNRLYETETERRRFFSQKHGEHFLLHTMFKGFEDKPPNITTKVPRLFDANLPEITTDEISWLKSSVPELEESLSLTEPSDEFPNDIPCTYSREKASVNARHISPASNSQTPCVVTATEGPATPFTVPELHTSKHSCHHQTIPTVSDSARKDVSVETSIKTVVCKSSQGDPVAKGSKETQTSVILISHENKCVGTTEEPESDSSKAVVSGKQVSTTDSSSPISSNEFATADFYFEDSMPSPMVESGVDRKADDLVKYGTKEYLANQLREKTIAYEELNDLLKQKEEDVATLQNELRSLKGENSEHMEFFSMIGPLEEDDTDQRDVPSTDALGVESTCCQTESSVDDRVKDLEQKLEKLTNDLDQSQLSLTKAEQNLQIVQEQEQTVHEKNNCLISQLREEIAEKSNDLVNVKEQLDAKELEVTKLKDGLYVSNDQRGHLQKELGESHTAFEILRTKLTDFSVQNGQLVPSLRKDLESLKVSVMENMSQFDVFKASAVSQVGKEMLSFSSIISGLEQEKEGLKTEMCKLEEDLRMIKNENTEETSRMKSHIDSLTAQLTKQEETFALKYKEQKNDFDCSLQDIETKHALEMELEVDKCRAEMKELQVELERKFDDETVTKVQLLKDLDTSKKAFEKDREELEYLHKCKITDLETKYEAMKQQSIVEWQEKLDERKRQIQALETDAVYTAAASKKEKEDCLETQKNQLTTEYDERLQDTIQKHEEQTQKYAESIEELQLKHAYKLTELKKSFDQERDLFQSELKKYKDNVMISSQTQTELELLAEVISLTSSASDGMEEPTSPRENVERKSPVQSNEGGLSEQLDKAHDDIKTMDEKMKALICEIEELKDRLKSQDEVNLPSQMVTVSEVDSVSAQSQYQNMMQTSASSKSFILMEKDKQLDQSVSETDEMKLKDQKIAHLEKHIMEMSMTTSGRVPNPDKISFRGCDVGDLVLLCLDVKHDQYVVFTVGTNLHFLHSESLEGLGLKSGEEASSRKPWILAEVMDKEYCLAKKPNNRFRVPQGTCFYRVKCQPWKCDIDLTKHKDKESRQTTTRGEPSATGGRTKKSEKK